MNLADLRQALDSKKIGAVDLTNEYLNRIKKHDSVLNSYITVCDDIAIRQAVSAQEIIDSGSSKPLTGIPVSIKDNICTKDIRTTCASRMLEDFVPVYDATAVKKLKSEGGIILGKTNMDEFAMGSMTSTSYFGSVKNPYNTEYAPGGSSGGAAAAVAGGLCVAALASDTGGSIRQPAALCGVTGLKPTYGTVSRYGLIAYASSLDQIGIIANNAFDTGYILNSIYGYDKNDSTTSPDTTRDYTSLISSDVSKIRIGIPKEFFESIDKDVYNAVQNAVDFYRELGCEIIECSLPSLEYAVSAYYLISSAEAAANLARFDGIRYGFCPTHCPDYTELVKRTRSEGFGTEVKRRIMLGNYALSSGYYDAYYNNACRIRTQIQKEYTDIFDKCDVILTPTTPSAAYRLDTIKPDNPADIYREDIFTVTASIAGLPAISTPCGYTNNGMPIGMSITGRAFDEKTIISLCDRFEQSFVREECII